MLRKVIVASRRGDDVSILPGLDVYRAKEIESKLVVR